jgi:hypothetical protein
VRDVVVKPNKNGDDMLVLALSVVDGISFKAYLVCDGKEDSLFAKNLAQCLAAFGIAVENTDDFEPEQLVGKEARAVIDIRTAPDGAKFNYVKTWLPSEESDGDGLDHEDDGGAERPAETLTDANHGQQENPPSTAVNSEPSTG